MIQKMMQYVTKGNCVLLQDVAEDLDPSLDNLLNKSLVKSGNEMIVKIGENEITYSNKF